MSRFFSSIFMVCLLTAMTLVISLPASAGQSVAKDAAPAEEMEEMTMEEAPVIKDTDVSIYGRFWPRVTYKDADGGSTDITDALSRAGIKANTRITDTLTAVLHGEWDVDIEANGDFGDARLAYVGLKGAYLGFVGIGKQWDPYYNIVAEVTDIFYHRASPFGYDNEGPFRSNNLVRYANRMGNLSIDAGMQVNGSPENNAGDKGFFRTNADASSDSDDVDAASVGLSYSAGPLYLGASYLRQNKDDDDLKRNMFGVSASLNATENLYLAVTYQYIQEDPDMGPEINPYTLDVVGSISFSGGIKALAGFFSYDDDVDGTNSKQKLGGNFTLVKELHPSTDVFVEWLIVDPEEGETENTISLGFRYDFDVAIF
ncbi:MAG: porin [Candidatus Dadabacteria bacterium]|nr:porin [Candidatus Dadabacteria bacterium]